MSEELVIGLVSISDRASAGVYKDEGIPSLKEWLNSVIASPRWRDETRLIADEQPVIEQTLKELADEKRCHLILTTGGTGPARRDVTPEATLAVADKVMPGFGEQMRAISLRFVPTAILSRQVAVIRGGGGQRNGAEAAHGRLADRIPGRQPGGDVLLDLVHQDHRIAHDHAGERDRAQHGDEAERLAEHEQRKRDTDDSERRGEQHHE